MKREITFDIMRGLAIVLMICANAMGELLVEPHSYFMCVVGSIAAPMFIIISGLMVALTMSRKDYEFNHYLKRGAIVVGAGVFLDVIIWSIYPFTFCEVLYLIGISIPLVYLFMNIKNEWFRWIIILFILIITPYLQGILGYTDYPTEINLDGTITLDSKHPTSILNHFIIDGWFPLFPWLAFAFLGANLYSLSQKYNEISSSSKAFVAVIAIILIFAGFGLWAVFDPNLVVRHGYSELFYPPTYGFMLWSIGFIILLFVIIKSTDELNIWKPFVVFGKTALFVYLLHFAIIENVLTEMFEDMELTQFLALNAIFTIVLFIAAYMYLGWKKSLAKKNIG